MSVSPTATSSSDLYAQLGIGQQNTGRATSAKDLGMDSFLHLMTEQMKNQDPTKPMDSAAYLGQLAQFASVQGLQQLGTQVQGVTTMIGQGQAVQVAGLIGHDAYIKTNTGALTAGGTLAGKVDAPAAGSIQVQVKDGAGNIVRTMNVAATAAGETDFAWDGRDASGQVAPAGNYSFTATSGTTSVDVQLAAKINSVSFTAQGIVLNLEGHDGVTFDQILSIS